MDGQSMITIGHYYGKKLDLKILDISETRQKHAL